MIDQPALVSPSPLHRLTSCRHGLMLSLKVDQIIGRALELYGEFAESENRLMTSFLGQGDIAVDVGANIGTVTLALSRKVGAGGRVLAFEPQHLIFQCLCANLVLNGISNVIARPAAIGAKSGQIAMPRIDLSQSANLGATRLGHGRQRAPLLSLDSLGLPRCALIKLDIEGMELAALRGAERTIKRTRPVIYFEAKTGPGTAACLRWLIERDYRLWWHFATFFDEANFRGNAENVFGNTGDINALALPKEHERVRDVTLPSITDPDEAWQQSYALWQEKQRARHQ